MPARELPRFASPPPDAPLPPGGRLTVAAGVSAALHVAVAWLIAYGLESGLYGELDPVARAGPVVHARLEARGAEEGMAPAPVEDGAPGARADDQSVTTAHAVPAAAAGPQTTPGATALPETGYFAERDVDVRATPVHDIDPDNPDHTGTLRGYVLLSLRINTRGTVDRIIVVRAQPDFTFGPDAFAAFRNARFNPALRAGVPVPSEKLVELRYAPNDAPR